MIFVNWLNRLKLKLLWLEDNREGIDLWAEANKRYFEGKHMNREHRLPANFQTLPCPVSLIAELEESEQVTKLFESVRDHALIVGISEHSPTTSYVLTLDGAVTSLSHGFRTTHTLKVYHTVNGQSRAQALHQALRILTRFQRMIDAVDHSSAEV